jgi:hypothetical protein
MAKPATDEGADTTVTKSELKQVAHKRGKRILGITEIVELKGRGQSLTIDSGWREVADTELAFVQRFV